MIRVNEIKFGIKEPFEPDTIKAKICKKINIKPNQLLKYQIVRESIDARKDIVFSYTIDVETTCEPVLLKRGFKLSQPPYQIPEKLKSISLGKQKRPVIIGFGPAGIFAGLIMARAGLKPIIFEQGEAVEQRTQTVKEFWDDGQLNIHSNVQFGEGGAGTFSDGKLTTRIKDERIDCVLNALIEAGAPEEICYRQKPHIGTDILKTVVRNLRNEIIKLGGEIHFSTKVIELILRENEIQGVKYKRLKETSSEVKTLDCNRIVLAIGHSAREMFYHLKEVNVALEAKPFAVGVRIEHPQSIINVSQYGAHHDHSRLGAADYKLTYQASNGRSVYSFCMCPGGEVVASSSEAEKLVVNGMSEYARDKNNANSAILINIAPEDCGVNCEDPTTVLMGIEWQRKLESKAYYLGGGEYIAPTMTVGELIHREWSKETRDELETFYAAFNVDYNQAFEELRPTYVPGTKNSAFDELFSSDLLEALKEALNNFGKKIKGFDDPRAIMTAVESRSSSPVRILRDRLTMESVNIKGLYPCGEGAGYAGGITSSCVDGIKVAEKIMELYLETSN